VISRKYVKVAENVGYYLLLILGMAFVLFPILWMISTAFKDKGAMFAYPPQWIPLHPTLESFKVILNPQENPFLIWFRNSILVGIGTAIFSLLLAVPAGYAFSRFRFRARNMILLFIITSQMFPIVLLLISIYLMYNHWGFVNTLHGLVLAYMSFALPFAIWMLKNYFDTIPRELEEAALIDGCGRLGAMARVALPLIGPAAVSVGTFCFLVAWNELLFAMTLNTSDAVRPLAPGILIRYAGSYQSSYNEMMAASFLASIPVIIIFITMQRYVVAGLTLGAVKG
jgi:multiple sugar transport system permease protein